MVILITALTVLVLLFIFLLFVLYYITFGPMRKITDNYRLIPNNRHYNEIKDRIMSHIDELEKTPCEDVTTKSRDGLTLFGRYYKRELDGIIELDFHGYRGHALRDYCGGAKMCLDKGRSSIIVEQRSHGRSDGNVITFGIRERYDVLSWVDYAIARFGKDVKIILSGVSMGAATVLMASELNLPDNVVGIIADCPYTSPKEIITKVAYDKGLPGKLIYPLIKLSAKILARVDIDKASAIEAVKNTDIPILIIHGTDDRFVPYDMGKRIFEACASSKKQMLSVEGAGHATSYFKETNLYVESVNNFLDSIL